MNPEKIQRRLKAIKGKGFIPSIVEGPTGMSRTLEVALGLSPSKRTDVVEVCNECGESVAQGSGKYCDRMFSDGDTESRKEMGKPFPQGDYMCLECDTAITESYEAGLPDDRKGDIIRGDEDEE